MALANLESIEAEKDATYSGYYQEFHPFVISLAGGVSERSWGVLKRIAGVASDAARPRLRWERYMWAVHMLKRINAGMAKVLAWETRVSLELPGDAVVRLVEDPSGRGLEVVAPGAPRSEAARLAEFFPMGGDPEGEDSVLPPVGRCVGVCVCGCDCLSMRQAFAACA